ncbi:protein TBATA-like [Pristis pectinata]|uniref:protein TBATA-like n=1 Tax=Pristis pectinata TaxID=685728 RepID=UPI00223D6ABF|nr:protein TBATA-like [Pristis pectinata]
MTPTMNFQVGPTNFRMNNFENEFRNEPLLPRSRNGLPLPSLGNKRPATSNTCKYAVDTSFYTRNNPHPKRVYHIKGLNNALVCKVDDDGVCHKVPVRSTTPKQEPFKPKRPITANIPIMPPSPAHLITGLPLSPCKEEAQPDLGLLYSQAWREALKDLTARVEFFEPGREAKEEEKWTSPYSGERGNLCSSPSRPVSRSSSRPNSRAGTGECARLVLSVAEREILVLELLSQILQTDSLQAVQQWLLVTSPKDKEVVLDMIRMAVSNMRLASPVCTMSKEGSASRQTVEDPEAIFRAPTACERRRARSQQQKLEAILEKEPDKKDFKALETTKSPCPCLRNAQTKTAKKPKALGNVRKILNVPSSPIMEGKLCHSKTDFNKT